MNTEFFLTEVGKKSA